MATHLGNTADSKRCRGWPASHAKGSASPPSQPFRQEQGLNLTSSSSRSLCCSSS